MLWLICIWYDLFVCDLTHFHVAWLIPFTDMWYMTNSYVAWFIHTVLCMVIPGHRNHRHDPASVFRSTHWWSQHPACQRCFYKPSRNCHPSQRVSTPPVETLIFDKDYPFLKTRFFIINTYFWVRFLIRKTDFWDQILIRKTDVLIRKTETQFL